MITIPIIIISLFLLSFSKAQLDVDGSTFLSRDNNQSFRGLLALLIVFHHVSRYYEFPLDSQGGPYGMVVVGLFFFISGYGLMKQFESKGSSYLNDFLKKRFKKLLPSYCIILLVILIVSWLLDVQLLEVKRGRIGCILIPNSWYVYVLFFYYTFFAITTKRNDPEKVAYALLLSTFALIALCFFLGLGEWWWRSTFAFNVGTFVPIWERQLRDSVKPIYINRVLFCVTAVLILCTAVNILGIGYSKVRFLLKIFLATLLPVFLYIVFCRLHYPKNVLFSFLGSISYEIYLLHGVVIAISLHLFPNIHSFVSISIIYITSIVLSWAIKLLSDRIRLLIR